VGVPILRISRLLRQNDIWVLAPWLSTKYIIRGKVVASFKFKPWWVLWVLLFDLCKSVWVIELLVNLPSPHPRAPTRPSILEMLWTKERNPNSFSFCCLHLWTCNESIEELRGVLYKIDELHTNTTNFIWIKHFKLDRMTNGTLNPLGNKTLIYTNQLIPTKLAACVSFQNGLELLIYSSINS
jgi:hypothetical protein